MSGSVPTRNLSGQSGLQRRLLQVENTLQELRNQLSGGRLYQSDAHRDVRLAVTVNDPQYSPSYPAQTGTGHPRYPIKFIDSYYPGTVGWGVLTTQTREETAASATIAAAISKVYYEPNTPVLALWQRAPVSVATSPGGEWYILTDIKGEGTAQGITLEPLKIKDTNWLLPGGDLANGTKAARMIFNAVTARWEEDPNYDANDPTKHELVYDDFYRNMAGPGEILWCKKRAFHATTNPNDNKWDAVSSQGLFRRGKQDGNTDCGAKGKWTVYGDEPADYTQTVSCFGGGGESDVDMCNVWGFRRKLGSGEELTYEYDIRQRQWYPVRDVRPNHVKATAQANFCGQSEVGLNDPKFTDWRKPDCTLDADDVTAGDVGQFNLAGEGGDNLWLERDEGADKWYVTQVRHKIREYVEEVEEKQGSCPQLSRDRKLMVTMSSPECGTVPDGVFFYFQHATFVEDIREKAGGCGWEVRWRDVCVGSAATPGNYQPLIDLQPVEVLDSVGKSGDADLGGCSLEFGSRVMYVCNPTVGNGDSVPFETQKFVEDVELLSDKIVEHKRNASVLCVGSQMTEDLVPLTDCPEQTPPPQMAMGAPDQSQQIAALLARLEAAEAKIAQLEAK